MLIGFPLQPIHAPPMRILADENIPFVREAFASLGEVRTIAGRGMTPDQLGNADMLLVRSVTRVDEALLAGSNVQFVATATIGVDHVSTQWLTQQGIGFASAPGSNAISAAEYVVTSLWLMAQRQGRVLQDLRVAIIGCGNVGSRVFNRLEALGVECLVNDPPRSELDADYDYRQLHECLDCDAFCVHVPLTTAGPHATLRFLDHDFFEALPEGAIFLNAARGSVVDEAALSKILDTGKALNLVLDVWANEPNIDERLVQRVQIGTAHIAGYSLDGKVRGTELIYRAACAHLGAAPSWSPDQVLPESWLGEMRFGPTADDDQVIQTAMLALYDPRQDDARLRIAVQTNPGNGFDRLRREYPPRREFNSLRVVVPAGRSALRARLDALGFKS